MIRSSCYPQYSYIKWIITDLFTAMQCAFIEHLLRIKHIFRHWNTNKCDTALCSLVQSRKDPSTGSQSLGSQPLRNPTYLEELLKKIAGLQAQSFWSSHWGVGGLRICISTPEWCWGCWLCELKKLLLCIKMELHNSAWPIGLSWGLK